MGNGIGNPKDTFYYDVSEYARKKNPNISQEELDTEVSKHRSNPELFYSNVYKDINDGKLIDKKTLSTISEEVGFELDPKKLSPTQINFVDNDKNELLSEFDKIEKTSSNLELLPDASDTEIEKFVNKQMLGRPVSDYETEKKIRVNNIKKKRDEYLENKKVFDPKIIGTDLTPVPVEDFFFDARKKTTKTNNIFSALLQDKSDFFSGNDAEQELTNASIQSDKYLKLLEDQTKKRLNNIKDVKEKQIAQTILGGKKPDVEEGFRPSPELEGFLKSYDTFNEQYTINATQFGSVIKDKKKTYNDQLIDYRQEKQKEADKNQKLFTVKDVASAFNPVIGSLSPETPSVYSTWLNKAMDGMMSGFMDVGNAFYSNELEAKIKEAKKSGNEEEYLNLQRKLALAKFKENKYNTSKTTQRSDITQPIWEDRKIVDGFTLRVNSKGEYQGIVDVDGKIVHTLSNAQQKAVEKYQQNPESYQSESGFSKGWWKSLGNSAAQTTVEMVPMIAGGIATAPLKGMGMMGAVTSKVVPMTPMFMSSYHDSFTERFEKTGDWSSSSTYGILNASLETIPEFLMGIEPKVVRSFANRGLTAEVVQTAGKRAADIVSNASDLYKHSFFNVFSKELAKDVGSELSEEFLTLYGQSAVKNIYGEDGSVSFNDILTTLLVTPLATAPMSSITNIQNYKKSSDFKSMILAAASDYDKTAELMTEAIYRNKKFQENAPNRVKNFVNNINEADVKKKLELVKAVSDRKDNYSARSGDVNIVFTEKENAMLEDYMFEEAVGIVNGKNVDYTKEVDAIIAEATKRSKIESIKEKNDPIIPQQVVTDENKDIDVPETEIEVEIEDKDLQSNNKYKKLLRNKRNKNKNGFSEESTVGVDGQYKTISNDERIEQGNISLNFNITNDDAQILASEVQDIADKEGIKIRLDVANIDNNADVPLRISFESTQDAKVMYNALSKSQYYNQMSALKTDRILGKTIDEKAQFGVNNVKDIRKAQDIIDNSIKNDDGSYTYNHKGVIIPLSSDQYNEASEILFAADNLWSSEQETIETPQVDKSGIEELRSIVSERDQGIRQLETRIKDPKGFERLNVKSDANLQDAFDYTDGDIKEIPVFRNGQKGVLRVNEGGAMEFDNGTQIIEYGNISDQRTTTLSELGFTLPEDFKVKNDNIVIDGELYQNPYSSPDAAITRDEDGNIQSVELEKREIRGGYNGIQVNDVLTPVTFTGQRAIDIATILMEKELASNTKLREEFEAYPAPNIEPSFVPKNVTVDQLGEILLDYFPDKPALAMETAKIYFAQAVRMSTNFPQQYPTPASYIIDKINKDTVDNITNIERLKSFITNIINTTDNQERIDFAQKTLDNINRIQEYKVQTPQDLLNEINSKLLIHISLGPGIGMGQNEANGTYLSTEKNGNRYELIKTPRSKIYSAKVNISNPYDLDANMDDINSLRNRNLHTAIQRYISDNNLKGNYKKQLESVKDFDNEILETFVGFDQYIANAVTDDLQSKGYDSLYSRQSEGREGYLVVFNKDNVTLTEQKFVEKVIKRPKKDGRGRSFYSKLGNMIEEKLGGPGNNVRLNAMLAITSGKISKQSFLKHIGGVTEAGILVSAKILSSKDGISIEKASENTEVDDVQLRDAIIDLLGTYDKNPNTGTYEQWLKEVRSYFEEPIDPRYIAFENDAEYREAMEREAAAELEREIMERIPPDLYAELEDIDVMDMSFEEIESINNFMANIPGEEMANVINSLLPFDPEFEFISEQIENKIEDGKQEDIQGEDGDVVAGEAGNDQRKIDNDRQEVEDQGGVIKEKYSIVSKILNDDGSTSINFIPSKNPRPYKKIEGEDLFYHKENDNIVISDNISGAAIAKGKTLKDAEDKLSSIIEKSGGLQDFKKTLSQQRDKVNNFLKEERQKEQGNIVSLENSKISAQEESSIIEAIIENNNNNSWGKVLRRNVENLGNGWYRVGRTVKGESVLHSPILNKTYIIEGAKSDSIAVNSFLKNNNILSLEMPKVVDEIERVQKLEVATNQLEEAKRRQKELEKEITQLNNNIEKNVNENQANLFGEGQPNLGLDDIGDQRRILNERKAELANKKVEVYDLEQQVENLRDLKNQAEIDFGQDVVTDPIEQEIITHADTIRNKFRQEFTSKGIPSDQVDAAIALMDVRSNRWAKEEPGRKPDDWYSQIADVRSEELIPNEPISDIVEEFQGELPPVEVIDFLEGQQHDDNIETFGNEIISENVELDNKKSEVAKVERLEDFGEKIGGAKKDISQRLAEITGNDIATKPLSKSFPEPNYKKLVEDGIITQEGAIFLKFFYQNIPSKPRKEYRIPQWTRQVQNGIDLFRQVIEADNTKDFDYVQKMMDSVIVSSTVKRDYRMFSETMKGLGFPDIDVKLGDFSIKQFENGFYTNEEGYKVKAEEKYTIVKGYSIVKDFTTMEDAIRGLGQILFSAADKKVGTKFDIYQDTRTKTFFVGKKGTKVIRIVDGFETAKEAREFLKEQQESVQGIWDNMKNIPDERRNANRERIGIDWRNSRNISSEEFGQTFGFRGVEFGNWVNNQERQLHVNEAFDALMDLSSALRVSPKALSLNGELGLAFGARGSGKALAHYEPGKVVINLTKKKGSGSLAHEWWHALDNYFSRTRGLKDSYLTESPRQRMNRDGTMDQSIRLEIINGFKDLMKTITGSKIKQRSAVLDGPRSKQYWSTDIEMSARAFENYIIEKLGATNHRNDYLANFKETGEWMSDASQNLNALENYPYPLADESPIINEAFDSLFEAMHEDATGKLYQDDKGAVETLDDGRKVIIAMNAPDFSTMVHEIAHIFESELSSDEQRIVKDFGGSEPFARAFENYLREGNAPNQEIQSLFDKFKNWMTNIYRILKGSPIDVNITHEIRQIFDRLLSEQNQQDIIVPIDNTKEQLADIKSKLDRLREVNKIKLGRLQLDPVLSNQILQLTDKIANIDPDMAVEIKSEMLAEIDKIASDIINDMIIKGDIIVVDTNTGKPCI